MAQEEERRAPHRMQGVHAHLLSVIQGETVEREEQTGGDARSPIAQLAAGGDEASGGQDAGPGGRQAEGELAFPQEAATAGQEPIIAGWVDVSCGVSGDGGGVARGLHPAVAFVIPEGSPAQVVEAQRGGDQQDADGEDPPGLALGCDTNHGRRYERRSLLPEPIAQRSKLAAMNAMAARGYPCAQPRS